MNELAESRYLRSIRWWSVVSLIVGLILQLCLRLHSLSEPLDCDEAVYAYIGHRLLAGDRLYVDVWENKPPGAFLLFATAISIGGYTERCIRLLPIPFVLATLLLLWKISNRFFGPVAAILTALCFGLVASDPFTYAESANLNVFVNAFSVAALYFCAVGFGRPSCFWPLATGVCLGSASIIKQIALPHFFLYAGLLFLGARRKKLGRSLWLRQTLVLCAGMAVPWLFSIGLVWWQGVMSESFFALLEYAPTLAREASSPHGFERLREFVMGRPGEPWWGTGIWPLLVLCGLGLPYSMIVLRSRPAVLVVAGWTALSFLEAYWPGMNWRHYYLLPLPGLVLLAAIGVAALAEETARRLPHRSSVGFLSGMAGLFFSGTMFTMLFVLQWRQYIQLSPEEISARHRGGKQWVAQRQVGLDIRETIDSLAIPDARIYVWGWQAPLHFYSGADSVTPYFFADPLLAKYPEGGHRLVEPRVRRIEQDLLRTPPAIIFVGDEPPEWLRKILERNYVPVGRPEDVALLQGRGEYLRRDLIGLLHYRSHGRL